jgi:hypothetical protein
LSLGRDQAIIVPGINAYKLHSADIERDDPVIKGKATRVMAIAQTGEAVGQELEILLLSRCLTPSRLIAVLGVAVNIASEN